MSLRLLTRKTTRGYALICLDKSKPVPRRAPTCRDKTKPVPRRAPACRDKTKPVPRRAPACRDKVKPVPGYALICRDKARNTWRNRSGFCFKQTHGDQQGSPYPAPVFGDEELAPSGMYDESAFVNGIAVQGELREVVDKIISQDFGELA